MDITVWKCWMLFHALLSLPGLGFMCISWGSDTDSPMADSPTASPITTDSPTTGKCDIQLTYECLITTNSANDTILWNYTIWACANGGDTSIRWSPDCCLDDNVIDAGTVLNLTTEETTKIECSPFSSNPPVTSMYKWRMDAPTQSKILLRVRHSKGTTIHAREGDDSGIAFNFSANSFEIDGDSFLSSSYSVTMETKLEMSAKQSSFIVSGRALEVTDTVNATNIRKDCSLSSSVEGGNKWFVETECDHQLYGNFQDSCYQFNNGSDDKTDLSTARRKCEDIDFHLVYIESGEEQEFVGTAGCRLNSEVRYYWIGIQEYDNGTRVWMDGSAITYSNFGRNSNNESCFQLRCRNNTNHNWVDRNCENNKNGYTICEREQGYNGNSNIQEGCVSYESPLLTKATEGAILLKFNYYIKTYGKATIVWRGNHFTECRPDNDQTLFQNGLQINISCGTSLKSSGPWAVTFQARGAGLVQMKDVQFIYNATVNQQSSGRTAGVAVTIVMVLLVVILVAVAGFLWYKRRQRYAASNRKPQLQNPEVHVHNPTYENSVDQGDRSEYADSIDPVLGSPNYVNHFVASGLDQQQGHPGAGSDFPTSDNVVIEDGEHVYSGTLGDEEEDGYHKYSILERDLEKEPAEGNVSSGQDLSGYGRRHPPQRIVVNGVEYSLVDLEQKVQKPDTKHPHDVSRDGQGYPPRGIVVNNVKYTLVDLEQKAKRRNESRPLEQRRDDSSEIGTTGAFPNPCDVLQRGAKTFEESSASGYGSLEPVNEDFANRSWESKPKTTFQDPVEEPDDSYDHFQRRHLSGPPNHNRFAKKQTADDYWASSGVEGAADNTYQTMDDGQEDQDNEEYSRLQRQ